MEKEVKWDPNEFDPNKIKIDSKAVSPDYNPGPFYFVEASETGEIRMPCWSPDPDPLMEIMLELLKTFPEDVGVLIKARVETSSTQPKEDEWLRFFGYCNKRGVQNAVVRFRKFIQCDSTHQFMVRNTDTGEYLALMTMESFGYIPKTRNSKKSYRDEDFLRRRANL